MQHLKPIIKHDLLSVLKAHKLFSSLNIEKIEKIVPLFKNLLLPKGNILFQQGEPSTSIFLLVSGRLSAFVLNSTQKARAMGRIEPGETVGELGALSGEPRSLTVEATIDSTLFELSSKDFITLCHQHPAILFAAMRPIVTRSQKILHMIQHDKQINEYIAIAPINSHVPFKTFCEKLIIHTNKFTSLIVISDLDDEWTPEKIYPIEHNKKISQRIIYLLTSLETPLAQLCLKKIGLLYLVAEGSKEPTIEPTILRYVQEQASYFSSSPELILIYPSGTKRPRHTASYFSDIHFKLHHHLKIDSSSHYQRLIRFIRGTAVGVVLGGGGTRGFAHVGALKALREKKIPIDMIGGASVGAIVAACYAINESTEEAYHLFQHIVEASRGSVSWKSITWPYISLFDSKKFTLALQNTFDMLIEDLWIPFFCVSSNVANDTEAVHQSGLLWEKLRASAAVPGIIPPMILNGDLHLDGGLLNNLPVDIMRDFLGDKARIIAIELNGSIEDKRKYDFPPILTLKETLLLKLRLQPNPYKFPRFIDNFLRGLMLGSSAKTRQNGLSATLLINLSLTKFRLLHASLKQAEKLTDIGYAETLLRLKESPSDS